jgi:hypothetical protein
MSRDEYKQAGMSPNERGDGYERAHGSMMDTSRWRGVNKGGQEGSIHATSMGAAPAPAATAGTTAGRSSGGGWDTENEQGPV